MKNLDFVMPNKNEKSLIFKAKQLGIKHLCLVYKLKDLEKKEKKQEEGIKLFYGVLCNTKDLGKAKRLADFTLVQNPERKAIEKKNPDMVFDLELGNRRDFIFQRNSGLNHILCRFMKENDIVYYVNFNQISESKNKQILLGRIIQNLRLCKKYNVKVGIASFSSKSSGMRNPSDMRGFLNLKKKKFIYHFKN